MTSSLSVRRSLRCVGLGNQRGKQKKEIGPHGKAIELQTHYEDVHELGWTLLGGKDHTQSGRARPRRREPRWRLMQRTRRAGNIGRKEELSTYREAKKKKIGGTHFLRGEEGRAGNWVKGCERSNLPKGRFSTLYGGGNNGKISYPGIRGVQAKL